MSMNNPSFSPGRILREELDARGWSYIEFAQILGRPVQAVSEILNDRKEITVETALEIGRALGTSAELWLNLQTNYRLRYAATSSARLGDVERRARLRTLLPLREVVKRDWLPDTTDLDRLEAATCTFLGMHTIQDKPAMRAAARRSGLKEDFTPQQSAWLARVAQVGATKSVEPFARDALGEFARQLPSRLRDPVMIAQIGEWLASCGVVLVCEMPLKSSKLDGAVIWQENSSPIIGLSTRGNRFDSFVFTLLHEIAHLWHEHVTMGGLTFDEQDKIGPVTEAQEKEADLIAAKWIFPERLNVTEKITTSTIVRLARSYDVHPSLVIGRLQRDKRLAWSQFRNHIPRVRELLPDLAGK